MKFTFLIPALCLIVLAACRPGVTSSRTEDFLLNESEVPAGLPLPTIDWEFRRKQVLGQTIYVDPAAEMVIVRLSSHPQAKNGYIDPTSLPAYQAVAAHLISNSKK